MAFELSRPGHIEGDLLKIVRRELRKATRALRTGEAGEFRDAVHESRKSVKKIRTAVALLGAAGADVPRKDRKRLKKAARALSTIRDSAAIVDTFDRLRRRYPKQLPEHTYARLRRGLLEARDNLESRSRRDGTTAEAADQLHNVRRSSKRWATRSIDFKALASIAGDAYRESRNAMRSARGTGQSAAVHRWRKTLKTLWYILRLAKPLTAGVAPLVADMRRLETELGDDHNLVVLAATLRACPELESMRGEVRQIGVLATRLRDRLRRRAFVLGRRLHARKPKAFVRWLRDASRRHRRLAAAA